MEYTCKNSPREKETTIQLNTYDMVLVSESRKHMIPYPDVLELRLNKRRNLYFLHLRTLTFGTIYITSQTYTQTGERIDQSRTYLTFARVLHMHLQEKSKAEYFTGFNVRKLMTFIGGWAVAVSLFFIVEEYFDFLSANTFLLAALIFFAGTLLLVGLRLNRWPRPYQPTDIPLHMLPAAF